MPKVTQEYIEQKKKLIVEAAAKVCDKKAVCSVTMQDVIDEAGLSQGGIYRFYQNVDDILIDVLKWVSTFTIVDKEKIIKEFSEKLSAARNSSASAAEKIEARRRCIHEILDEVCSLFAIVLEKFQHPFFAIHFGFSDMVLNFPERAKYIFSQVESPFSLKNECKFLAKELEKEISDGVIAPKISVDEFMAFLRTSFMGINQVTLVDERYVKNIKGQKTYSAEISTRFKIVRKSCCYLLGLEEYEK